MEGISEKKLCGTRIICEAAIECDMLIIPDIHIRGDTRNQFDIFFQSLEQKCQNTLIRNTVFLGDVFDRFGTISVHCQSMWNQLLNYLVGEKKSKVYIMIGNHDIENKNNLTLHVMSMIATTLKLCGADNIVIVDEAKVYSLNGKFNSFQVAMIPYIFDQKIYDQILMNLVEELTKSKDKQAAAFVCTHADYPMGPCAEKIELLTAIYEKNNIISINGHIHDFCIKPPCFLQPGSVTRCSISDQGVKYIWTFNSADNTLHAQKIDARKIERCMIHLNENTIAKMEKLLLEKDKNMDYYFEVSGDVDNFQRKLIKNILSKHLGSKIAYHTELSKTFSFQNQVAENVSLVCMYDFMLNKLKGISKPTEYVDYLVSVFEECYSGTHGVMTKRIKRAKNI